MHAEIIDFSAKTLRSSAGRHHLPREVGLADVANIASITIMLPFFCLDECLGDYA
jgi:hypothetical protein